MKGLLAQVSILFALAGVAYGQTTEPLPSFDAADVHVSPRSANPNVQSLGGFVRSGRYQFRNATMVDLIASAYSVDAEKVLGGPSWLETDRFDILAKAPASATNATARLMLQSLLSDRFKLVVQNEDRPMDAFVMTAGKPGPQLKPSTAGGVTNCQGGTTEAPHTVISCKNITMAVLAQALRQIEPNTFTSAITDLTGVDGSFDFELKWTGR